MSKKLTIGLFGLGCVGQGFYELLEQSVDANLEIKKIVVKNSNKIRTINNSYFSTSPSEILEDATIDIVVELIDDAVVAFDILKQSLQNKKPVITANKKMLADHLEEIYWLQKKYQTPVLYEGSVCGSIPLIRNLETHYGFDELNNIEGIFNGSTNYILTKMIENKIDYHHALAEAQQLGFAESDPSLDIKGFDSKYKLAITIAHAFGAFVKPEQIINIGIDKISNHNIRFARQHNATIKLIAKTGRIGNKIFGLVAPQFISNENALAHIKNEFNAVNLTGASTGLQTMTGKGAGSLPTGLVVLADAIAVGGGTRYNYPKISKSGNLAFDENIQVNVQVSFTGKAPLDHTDFVEFNGGFQSSQHQSLSGWVGSQKLNEWASREDLSIILNQGQNIRLKDNKIVEELSLV